MRYYKSRNIVLSYASKYFRLDQTPHSSKDALFCYEERGLVCLRPQVNTMKKMIVCFSGHTCYNAYVFCAH